MRKIFPVLLTTLFLFPLSLFARTAHGAQPQTVRDYYVLIPENYLPREMIPNRKAPAAVEDVKNGYLKISGPWEGFAEIALFKKAQGGNIIGVTIANCGPACEQEIHFLEYSNGSWSDRTKSVLPDISNAMLENIYKRKKSPEDPPSLEEAPALYMLPRYGKTLEIIVQPEFTKKKIVLMKLIFDKDHFTIAK